MVCNIKHKIPQLVYKTPKHRLVYAYHETYRVYLESVGSNIDVKRIQDILMKTASNLMMQIMEYSLHNRNCHEERG